MNQSSKKVNVWDTYVTKKDGKIMHFDIIVPHEVKDADTVYEYGHQYLKTRHQEGQTITSRECSFCHMEHIRPDWEDAIHEKGYFILEMEGCN